MAGSWVPSVHNPPGPCRPCLCQPRVRGMPHSIERPHFIRGSPTSSLLSLSSPLRHRRPLHRRGPIMNVVGNHSRGGGGSLQETRLSVANGFFFFSLQFQDVSITVHSKGRPEERNQGASVPFWRRDIRPNHQNPTSTTLFSLSLEANPTERCGPQTRPRPLLSRIVQRPPRIDGCSNQVVRVPQTCDLQPSIVSTTRMHCIPGKLPSRFQVRGWPNTPLGVQAAQFSSTSHASHASHHARYQKQTSSHASRGPAPPHSTWGATRGGWRGQTLGVLDGWREEGSKKHLFLVKKCKRSSKFPPHLATTARLTTPKSGAPSDPNGRPLEPSPSQPCQNFK